MSGVAVRRHLAALLVGVALASGLCGCGRDGEGGGGAGGASPSPAGRWRFDRDALLAALAKDHAAEGPERVAQEQQHARDTNLELELRADGFYRMATLALGFEQRTAGTWRLDGRRLLFTAQRVDGKEVDPPRVEEARFVDDRIEIDFDHKTFVLVRHGG